MSKYNFHNSFNISVGLAHVLNKYNISQYNKLYIRNHYCFFVFFVIEIWVTPL